MRTPFLSVQYCKTFMCTCTQHRRNDTCREKLGILNLNLVLFQYYFGFVSDVWWAILTFCWFMSANKYWSSEGLNSYATYFHLLAWGLPAIGTVLIIIFKQVFFTQYLSLLFYAMIFLYRQYFFLIGPFMPTLSLRNRMNT